MSSDYKALVDKVDRLESELRAYGHKINELEKSKRQLTNALEDQKNKTNQREELKEKCIFSVRLKNSEALSKKDWWVLLDKNMKTYRASPYFNAPNCRFTAPVNGHYHFDLGMSQDDKDGTLEVKLVISSNGKAVGHPFVGKTRGPFKTCHKTMVLTLNQGDVVIGAVRKTDDKSPGVYWCAFHGFLIMPSSGSCSTPFDLNKKPSAPPSD